MFLRIQIAPKKIISRFGRADVIRFLYMIFQKRDGVILNAIYENDGVLAKRHLKKMFWVDKSWRAMEQRLKKLFIVGYISWPNREQYKIYPIPEPVCWLGWKGALYVAGKNGVKVQPPNNQNENQLRLYQKHLMDSGVRWVREPRWSLLRHDLTIVDFRLAMERSVGFLSSLLIEHWLPESEFRSNMDKVQTTIKTRNGKMIQVEKGVCPDAYFEVVDESRRLVGEAHRARFLLEIDMGTHDETSFGREKAAPGVAYIKSPDFKTRFGNNTGHWLIVTAGGDRRLKNLIRTTKEITGQDSNVFFFTTLDRISADNLLTSPIWWQAGQKDPLPLLR